MTDLSAAATALIAQKARADAEATGQPYYERAIYDDMARTTAPALAAAYLAMRKIIDMMKETIARSTHDSEVFQDFNEIEAAILAFERATGGDHD